MNFFKRQRRVLMTLRVAQFLVSAKTDDVRKELFYSAIGKPVGAAVLSRICADRAHLADVIELCSRLLVASRRSILRGDPPPYDRAPGTSSVINAHRRMIGSCQLAHDARKRTCRAGNQQECQKNSGRGCCPEAPVGSHELLPSLYVCRSREAGFDIFRTFLRK